MKTMHRILATGLLAAGALGLASTAQARNDVYWSVGVGGPGVSIGVGNAPTYYPPAPVYYHPAPVYQPAPVYYQPAPVYVRPRPVYYGPPAYYYGPPGYRGHRGHRHHRHGHGNGHWR